MPNRAGNECSDELEAVGGLDRVEAIPRSIAIGCAAPGTSRAPACDTTARLAFQEGPPGSTDAPRARRIGYLITFPPFCIGKRDRALGWECRCNRRRSRKKAGR